MITVTLYSREDCHLCEQARADLEQLQDEIPHRLVVLDVDQSAELRNAYGFEVPVIEAGPYRLKAPFNIQELRMTLGAARDRDDQLTEIQGLTYQNTQLRSQTWSVADRFTYWFGKHYLAVFNLFVLIYAGLPVLAPVLMKAGVPGPARMIYRVYGVVCHQLAYRSFFLFGEQVAYPRAVAEVPGLLTYAQVSGFGEDNVAQDLYTARDFVGTEQMGYKIALCERDISIYGAILFFGILFALTGRRLPPLPWYVWIVIGMVPIGADGLSQLLSQPPFDFFPLRESTPFLRTLTGLLFGFTTAWFGYPLVEETMEETRRIMASKRLRILDQKASQQVAD